MSAKLLVRYIMLALIAPTSSLNAEPWPTTEWQPLCYEGRSSECDLQDEGVAVSNQQLQEASRYFSTLGFLPPAVAADDTDGSPTKLPVYFEQKSWPLTGGGFAAGQYYPQYDLLRVSYEDFFAFNTETAGDMYTPTHELFHAIQFSYSAIAARAMVEFG